VRLLNAAGQTISPECYAWVLLDKLQPRYEQAVSALKAGTKLADMKKVDWTEIAVFINAHERAKIRQESDGVVNMARAYAATSNRGMMPRSYAGNSNGQSNENGDSNKIVRTMDGVQCFNCNDFGHISNYCPKPKRDRAGSSTQKHESSGTTKANGEQMTNRANAIMTVGAVYANEYFSLSGDEEEEAGKTNHKHLGVHSASVSERPATDVTP
jgi:hypothetical protein